jgi:hypothetical protein
MKLIKPHFQNPKITGAIIHKIDGSKLTFQWSDKDGNPLGSILSEDLTRFITIPIYDDNGEMIVDPNAKTEIDEKNIAQVIDRWLAFVKRKQETRKPEQTLDSKMYAVFKDLPVQVRASFAPAWVVVNSAVKLHDFALARLTIESVKVPPELQPLKDQLLAMLPK